MSGRWEHDDGEARWELVAYREDVPRMATDRIVGGWVTDEMIARVASPQMLAVHLFGKLGSVPPPLEEHLPPHDPNTVTYDMRDEIVARLREIALRPPDPARLAAEEAARADPWRWYCRLCGARGSVDDGPGAREARDKAAGAHLGETRCGRHEIPARAESGRLLHVWTYPRSAVTQWN